MNYEKNLLLIPESRKRPITESLLYKQIIKFFSAEGGEKMIDKFEIVFIEVPKGNLPPARFRSGGTLIKKDQIAQMADDVRRRVSNRKAIAYVRGAYLEVVRLANVESVLREEDLAPLKKQGIRWMKVGLRMDEAFTIFKKRIVEFSKPSLAMQGHTKEFWCEGKDENKPRTRASPCHHFRRATGQVGSVRGGQLTLF